MLEFFIIFVHTMNSCPIIIILSRTLLPIVGEMSVFVREVLFLKRKWSGGKSDQTIFVNVKFDWVNASQENVDPQIKLQSPYKIRSCDVSLDHCVTDSIRYLLMMKLSDIF